MLIKKDDHYIIERISNSYSNFNEIVEEKRENKEEQKHELLLFGDDSDPDSEGDGADAFYS